MKFKFELQLFGDHKTVVEQEFTPASYQGEFDAVVEQIALALMACGLSRGAYQRIYPV